MAKLRNNFVRGVIDSDSDPKLVPNGKIRHALNVDIIHSENGKDGVVKNKKGNTLISDISQVSGVTTITNAKTIGSVAVPNLGLVYWMVASDQFDAIFEYNKNSGQVSRVLQSSKSTPSTPSQLNFDHNFLITGINYYEGFINWVAFNDEPKSIKVERCKSYLVDDVRIDLDTRVIFPSPLNPPSITLIREAGQENNIEYKFVQFAYRFKNIDNQYSAMSPFSSVAFEAKEYEIDYGAGDNKSMVNVFNAVDVHFETGNSFVTDIELLVRDTKSLNVSIVESFNKIADNLENNNVVTYRFSNSKIYSTLQSDQLARLWDNVPLKARAQELIKRRIVYGDYVQFYDISRVDGSKIEMDFNVGFVSKSISVPGAPERTFRSNRDYEVGIIYGDSDGRFSTVMTSKNNNTYITPINSVNANSLVVNIFNDPPSFANFYRLVVKQSKKNFYNVFPILYYADGPFRYFLINRSEIDKIAVGEYVIFKADVDGPIASDTRYKILEIESKPANFLSNGSSQILGVYFKIKTENNSEFNPNALFTFTNSSFGTNVRNLGFLPLVAPVKFRHSVAEKAIHYGIGNPLGMSVVGGNQYNHFEDFRITIEITAGNTFRYTGDVSASSAWVSGIAITGSPQWIGINGTAQAFQIQFNTNYPLEIGDQWKVNCRTTGHLTGNIFGGIGIPDENTQIQLGDWGGAAVLPGQNWSETSPETDRAIEVGAVIKIRIEQDLLNQTQQAPVQQFPPSPRRYDNIEEWFIESGAYTSFIQYDSNGINVGAKGVTFRRGSFWENETVQQSNGQYTTAGQIYQGEKQVTSFGGNTIITDLGVTPEALNYPVHMIIQGFGYDGNQDNRIKVYFEIQQSDSLPQCETVPLESDTDIFHETSRTYPIENGKHKVLWSYEDFTTATGGTNLGQEVPGSNDTSNIYPHYFNIGDIVRVESSNINGNYEVIEVPDRYNIVIDLPFPGSGPVTPGSIEVYHPDHQQADQGSITPASIRICDPLSDNSDFNAFSFGNGIESDRILDDFNATSLEYSPRSIIPVPIYEQERKKASLTYSGVFRAESSLNRLNEFNLSNSNFKDLELEYGSIQLIYARNTDLMVFQEDKISRVLYEKNLLSDSIGGGTITSVPQVFGTQISPYGEWGISFNPESFSVWGGAMFCTDSRRNAVLMIQGDSIVDISEENHKSYIRQLFENGLNTQKLGIYTPRTKQYIISSNESSVSPCELSISSESSFFPSNTSSEISQVSDKNKATFMIVSNTEWTTSIVYSSGSDWVDNVPESGNGNQSVYAHVLPNATGLVRTATITITYCEGLTVTHVITQGASEDVEITILIFDKNYNIK